MESNNIPLESISTFVIGHAHFDHIGNLAHLPKSVRLVVGPNSPVGEQLADELDVAKEEVLEREVRVLGRETDKWENVGTFKGLDYFGDGSFWILDVPGVCTSSSNLIAYSFQASYRCCFISISLATSPVSYGLPQTLRCTTSWEATQHTLLTSSIHPTHHPLESLSSFRPSWLLLK